jgi:hypothetical protein
MTSASSWQLQLCTSFTVIHTMSTHVPGDEGGKAVLQQKQQQQEEQPQKKVLCSSLIKATCQLICTQDLIEMTCPDDFIYSIKSCPRE